MATRRRGSTRRKSPKREDDDDLEIDVDEDDDFAWQSPKKSKKKSTGKSKSTRSKTGGSTRKTGGSARSKAKTGGSARSSKAGSARSSASTSKKKATGKRKRPTGSSNENPKASSSMKRSGKRKKATSGRRSSAYDDDDDDNGSGRRRRAPPPKKKGVDPIIPISIITGSLILCGGIFFIRTRKSNVEVRDEDKMLKEADELTKKGIAAFKAWNKIKRENGAVALEIQKHKEALDLLERAAVKMEEALAPYRNKDTGFLKKEYQGYEKMLQEIGQYRYDLQKSARTQ